MARLIIWDIGGQDRFKSLRHNFYDGTHGALAVFDLSRAQTLPKMKEWIAGMNEILGEDIPVAIIGNKSDLIPEIGDVIDRDELSQYIKKENFLYIETSAKTGENVEEAFLNLTQTILKNINNK